MKRPICWTERLEDGTKREVRITLMRDDVKWQFKLSTEERWDYRSPPTSLDWDQLLQKMERRYFRRTIPYKDLELVRRLRLAAQAS